MKVQYLWQRLKETQKPIVLYGMGNGADRLLDRLEALGIRASGVFASDDFARGHTFRGFPVTTYAQAKEAFGDMTVLLAFGTQLPEVMERIRRIASEQELYAPDMPVYGDTFFTPEYFDAHRAEMEKVYAMLADGKSKDVFESIIRYRLTGRIDHLTACESDEDEAFGLLGLGEHESYLDLGAYNGDTVLSFAERVGTYESITAVEPDPKNYRKLLANTEKLERVTALNVGIGSGESQMLFSAGSGRGSSSGRKNRETVIPAASIDAIVGAGEVSFIKMDVEGWEKAALLGGTATIKRCRPKMLVSCYHRTEDIFELPLLVNETVQGYRLYMRHHPYFPAWDTNFYFVS